MLRGTAPPGYELLDELGRGGMGVVYKARDQRLGRTVALKMLLGGGHAGAGERQRFRREAEAVAQLSHPNIVSVYEVGYHAGLEFLAMEYCAGGSLPNRLGGLAMPARRAAKLVETLARGLHVAHQAGIVHRDIKPDNILLTADGTPKIADFGLAKQVHLTDKTDSVTPDDGLALEGGSRSSSGRESGGGKPALTLTGTAIGTPAYMAPEQAEGLAITPAADIYALGAVFYELLTGRPPFVGETEVNTLWMVLSQEPVAVRAVQPRVPRDLETICHKCLEKHPAKRYASAAELADDLRCFEEHKPIRARVAGPLERGIKWARRHPTAAGLVGLFVVSFVAVVVLLGFARAESRAAQIARRDAERSSQEALHQSQEANRQRLRAEDALHQAESQRLALAEQQEQIEAQRSEAQTQRDQAEKGRKAALENLALAGQAVRECMILASQNPLFQRPEMADAKALLLKTILPVHEKLTQASRAGDTADSTAAGLRDRLLDDLLEIVDFERTSDDPEVVNALRGLLPELQARARNAPNDVLAQRKLAAVLSNLSSHLRLRGDIPEASQLQTQAEKLLEDAVRAAPTDYNTLQNLASLRSNQSRLAQQAGRFDEALRLAQEALEMRQRLAAQFPNMPTALRDQAVSWERLSELHYVKRDMGKALTAVRQALVLRERLVGLARANPQISVSEFSSFSNRETLDPVNLELSCTLERLSKILQENGQFAEALTAAQKVVDTRREILRRGPDPSDSARASQLYQAARIYEQLYLAQSFNSLGLCLKDMRRFEDGIAAFTQGVAILERLLSEAQSGPDSKPRQGILSAENLAYQLATVLDNRSESNNYVSNYQAGRADALRGLEVLENRQDASPKLRVSRILKESRLLRYLAEAESHLGLYREAEDHLTKAKAVLETLSESPLRDLPDVDPSKLSFQRKSVDFELARLLFSQGQYARSVELTRSFLVYVEADARSEPDNPKKLCNLPTAQRLLGERLIKLSSETSDKARAKVLRGEGADLLERAVANAQNLVERFSLRQPNVQLQYDLARHTALATDLLRDLGLVNTAERISERSIGLLPPVRPGPMTQEIRRNLTALYGNHGQSLWDSRRVQQGLTYMEQGIAFARETLVESRDKKEIYENTRNLMVALANLASACAQTRRWAEATKAIEEAIGLAETLVRDAPPEDRQMFQQKVSQYQANLREWRSRSL